MPSCCSIVYLVLAHEDPGQFRSLLKRLECDTVRFHVHVDAKTDIAPFRRAAADVQQVFFCDNRVKVTWAAQDCDRLAAGQRIGTGAGPLRSLLTG